MFGRNSEDEVSQSDSGVAGNDDNSSQDWQHPGAPIQPAPAILDKPGDEASASLPTTSSPLVIPDSPTPHADVDMPQKAAPVPAPSIPDKKEDEIVDLSNHELIEIKQKALGQLNPLMGHLDQTPEEKFRTTMMMIQASDDQTLVKTAYEAAQQIKDEKVRAQALLDIVNEINYFTQQHTGQ